MTRSVSAQSSEQLLGAVDLLKQGTRYVGRVDFRQDSAGSQTIVASGSRDFFHQEKPMTEDTVVGIASMTKSFTSATLLKLWDVELEAADTKKKFFPDGIDTPISHFMSGLKEKFPQCLEAFEQIREEANKITLRDLMNHTHGLEVDWGKLWPTIILPDQKPLELSDSVNATKKSANYGKCNYSNIGYDYAGMIIELIASEKGIAESFDGAVKKLILEPNGLDHTYTQSEMKALYDGEGVNVSRGCIIDSRIEDQIIERDFNTKSNSRAGSGFKSSVSDLAKFIKLAVSAKMFNNEEVKTAVLDRSKAVPLWQYEKLSYHLAMGSSDEKGILVGRGEEVTGNSYVRYDPTTEEVKVWIAAGENVTKLFCDKVWNKTVSSDPNDLKQLAKVFAMASEIDNPDMEKKDRVKILEKLMSKYPRGTEALSHYASIMQDVLTYSVSDLMETSKTPDILQSLCLNDAEREKLKKEMSSGAEERPSASPSAIVVEKVAINNGRVL